MITAENLKRTYGDFVAVQGVSFNIERGEIVGLLGHNGAGKTTIMKMLTGFLEPTEGRVLMDGVDISSNRLAVQSRIGYLPEHSPLYPEMSVIQYLDYVCDLRSVPQQARRDSIVTALDRTGLRDKATQQIATLSKGYKQRLGVAQAILHNPDFMILDEPTNGLDPSQIQEMRALIHSLSKTSTILLSTHILQEVEAVCDRVIIILNGSIARDSKMSELRSAKRLVLATNQKPDVVSAALKTVDGVQKITQISNGSEPPSYALDLSREADHIAPAIAKLVVERGWELHKLDHERRNLESLFREISAGGK